jgi:hypothetical protein
MIVAPQTHRPERYGRRHGVPLHCDSQRCKAQPISRVGLSLSLTCLKFLAQQPKVWLVSSLTVKVTMNQIRAEIAQLERVRTVLHCHPWLMHRDYWVESIGSLLQRTDLSVPDRQRLEALQNLLDTATVTSPETRSAERESQEA